MVLRGHRPIGNNFLTSFNVAPSLECQRMVTYFSIETKKNVECLSRNLTKKEPNHDACQRLLVCYCYFVNT